MRGFGEAGGLFCGFHGEITVGVWEYGLRVLWSCLSFMVVGYSCFLYMRWEGGFRSSNIQMVGDGGASSRPWVQSQTFAKMAQWSLRIIFPLS